jgi:hypothetical protein
MLALCPGTQHLFADKSGAIEGTGMEFGLDKALVVEAEAALRERLPRILTEAGYLVVAEFAATLKTGVSSRCDCTRCESLAARLL